MSEIFVIGLNASGPTSEQLKLLHRSSTIISSKRLAALVPQVSAAFLPVTPLHTAIEAMENGLKTGNVAVLASGDPLFFGIARRLIAHFGSEKVSIFPALSSMQQAFARFRIPWDDVTFVSLHGRQHRHIAGRLLAHHKTFVFTDSNNSPDKIAKEIISYFKLIGERKLLQQLSLYVAENIGAEDERISSGTLDEIAALHYSDLNVLCIMQPELANISNRPIFGLEEEDISHSRGLITKDEVRAATLHRLQLPGQGVLWDIGGGSGSISIEAASMNPLLTVYTVEKKEEELENIKKNICQFGCFNIVPLAGNASDILHNLPDPNRVFIGGSGGELSIIVQEAARRMLPYGRLVINGVIEKTIKNGPELMRQHGLSVEMSTIEVTRTGQHGPVRFNPITIMVGKK